MSYITLSTCCLFFPPSLTSGPTSNFERRWYALQMILEFEMTTICLIASSATSQAIFFSVYSSLKLLNQNNMKNSIFEFFHTKY